MLAVKYGDLYIKYFVITFGKIIFYSVKSNFHSVKSYFYSVKSNFHSVKSKAYSVEVELTLTTLDVRNFDIKVRLVGDSLS